MNHEQMIEILKEIKIHLKKEGDSATLRDRIQAEIDFISDGLVKEDGSPTNLYGGIDKAFDAYPTYSKEQEDAVINAVTHILTGHFLVLV